MDLHSENVIGLSLQGEDLNLIKAWIIFPLSKCRKTETWGRRLAWTRIHAWGACDPGFKSQRPHHDNSGPYGDEFYHFRLLKILTSLNSQTYSKPASISFWAS